ncbi:hypothetical protein ADUPG1_007993 [Aduncisulcus paluster]|uniref:Uncharacterized protein n=1 Tax=Aduncisulcus paluster TaxID=2918883 RepID=A0ABQ5KQB4_9EUKA|nr:hypothetical protein ADUPG1_007993 [Aduncisulcus paluster]
MSEITDVIKILQQEQSDEVIKEAIKILSWCTGSLEKVQELRRCNILSIISPFVSRTSVATEVLECIDILTSSDDIILKQSYGRGLLEKPEIQSLPVFTIINHLLVNLKAGFIVAKKSATPCEEGDLLSGAQFLPVKLSGSAIVCAGILANIATDKLGAMAIVDCCKHMEVPKKKSKSSPSKKKGKNSKKSAPTVHNFSDECNSVVCELLQHLILFIWRGRDSEVCFPLCRLLQNLSTHIEVQNILISHSISPLIAPYIPPFLHKRALIGLVALSVLAKVIGALKMTMVGKDGMLYKEEDREAFVNMNLGVIRNCCFQFTDDVDSLPLLMPISDRAVKHSCSSDLTVIEEKDVLRLLVHDIYLPPSPSRKKKYSHLKVYPLNLSALIAILIPPNTPTSTDSSKVGSGIGIKRLREHEVALVPGWTRVLFSAGSDHSWEPNGTNRIMLAQILHMLMLTPAAKQVCADFGYYYILRSYHAYICDVLELEAKEEGKEDGEEVQVALEIIERILEMQEKLRSEREKEMEEAKIEEEGIEELDFDELD